MSQSTDDGNPPPRGALVDPDKDRDMRGIERLPSGRYRCTLRRTQVVGKKQAVESRAGSYEAALSVRNVIQRNDRENLEGPEGLTVAQWSKIWFSEIREAKATGRKLLSRKKKKLKKTEKLDLETIESHLNAHILESELANMPVRAVKAAHIEQFLVWLSTRVKRRPGSVKEEDALVKDGEILSETTQKRVFTTLGNMFFAAKEDPKKRCRNRIDPTVGLCVLTTDEDHDDVNKWLDDDIPLTLAERSTLLDDYGDDPERWIVEVALYTGMRQGEMWNLELQDVHLEGPEPYVWVKWGSKGLPPKNGEPRKVPLFGRGFTAMQCWLKALETYAPVNREGLVFPLKERISRAGKLRGGTRRRESTVPSSFKRRQKARVLGPKRDFHWHALRHSCATALLCGEEGPTWELIAISKLLGHKSLQVTQMYAKFRPTALFSAAAASRQWLADQEAKKEAPAPVAPVPAPVALPNGGPIDLNEVIARAVRETLAATGQLPGMAPASAPVPPPVPMVAQPTEPPRTPPALQSPPPVVTLPRPVRKGSANRRARPTVASSGDTEGPRRGSNSLPELTDPIPLAGLHAGSFSPPTGSLDGLVVAASVPVVSARAKRSTRAPATEKGTPEVHPSREPTMEAPPAAVASASATPAVEGVNRGVTGVHPEAVFAGDFEASFGPGAAKCPRSVHGDINNNDSDRIDSNTFGLRNRKSVVRILPGAQRFQVVTEIRPAVVDTAWTPREAKGGSPEKSPETLAGVDLKGLAPEPTWLTALQAIGSKPDPDPSRPIQTAKLTRLPGSEPPPTQGAWPPPSAVPPAANASRVTKARWLLAIADRGHMGARKVSEDLAMAVLMSPAEQDLYEVARAVLSDPDFIVPRGLQLAARLVERAAKPKGRKRGS